MHDEVGPCALAEMPMVVQMLFFVQVAVDEAVRQVYLFLFYLPIFNDYVG